MDYTQFRNQGSKNTVSVNHKALITRALTKYPVDFALFRELLQNSADAQANNAKIVFETSEVITDPLKLHQCMINKLTFSNDGLDFTTDDWNRLREIASGNPNETKIGAFGVGFYSVFELSDEPLVHSGNTVMSFRYEGVQLQYFVNNSKVNQRGTLIDLPYKTELQLPDLVKFIGFLVQSFLLVNLNSIDLDVVCANTKTFNLLKLRKEAITDLSNVGLPANLNNKTPNGVFKLEKLARTDHKIRIEYLNATQSQPLTLSNGWFSLGKQLVKSLGQSSGDPNEFTKTEFSIFRMDLFANVNVSSKFKDKMVETLLKPPPKQTVLSLIALGSNVGDTADIGSSLKSYVYPTTYNDAKVFVGFATKQSTGIKTHLALNQAIPTMERTAIDMSNQFVKDWNTELFYMAGVLARCTYELELKTADLETAGLVLSRFKFGSSAPDALVGEIIKQGFWNCSKTTLVISSKGIKPNSEVRLAGDAAKVLRFLPYATDDELADELKSRGMIKQVTIAETAADLAHQPVPMSRMSVVLDWLCSKFSLLPDVDKSMLMSAIKITSNAGGALTLGDFHTYFDKNLLMDSFVESTVPKTCLPPTISQALGAVNLLKLGIKPLGLAEWVTNVLQLVENNPVECGKMLKSICRLWDTTTHEDKKRIVHSLRVPCIPTSKGLKQPVETYVQEVKLFPDLPAIDQNLDLPKGWLTTIGLRLSVDMVYVLQALKSHTLEWNNDDLLQYLHENTYALKKQDWQTLAEGHFFVSELSNQRLRARDLFAPNEDLQRLGLPTIKLERYGFNSPEMKLLKSIGLRTYPKSSELFPPTSTPPAPGDAADLSLKYFVKNYELAKYHYTELKSRKVIPTVNGGLRTPEECFTDKPLALLDFYILKESWYSYAGRLGVSKSPPMELVLEKMVKIPEVYLENNDQMNGVFAYLSSCISLMNDKCYAMCQVPFLPIRDASHEQPNKVKFYESPHNVVFPNSEKSLVTELLQSLLPQVTVSAESKPFLQYLGVSDSPSIVQVAEILCRCPESVFANAKDPESYELLLTHIAGNWDILKSKKELVNLLKQSQFLIGYKHEAINEEENSTQYAGKASLFVPKDLVIVDNVIIFNQFKTKVVTSPHSEILESFYSNLGVPKLTSLLKQTISFGRELEHSLGNTSAMGGELLQLQTRIKERLKLFLENTSKHLTKTAINFDTKFVSSIHQRRELGTEVVDSKISAYFSTKRNILFLVPGAGFEWLHVADALVKAYLVKPDQDSVIVLEIQLSSDLKDLERKGYNVQNLKKQQKFEKSERLFREASKSNGVQQPMGRPPSVSTTTKQAPPVYGQPPTRMQRPPPPVPTPVPPTVPSRSPAPTPPVQKANGSNDISKFFSSLVGKDSKKSAPRQVAVDLDQALKTGVQQTKKFSQNSLTSQRHQDIPSPVSDPCTTHPKVENLEQLGVLKNVMSTFDMKLFKDKAYPHSNSQQDELLLAEALVVLSFAFNCDPEIVNIYRGKDTETIAFNYNGSLFFNSSVIPKGGISLVDFYYPVYAHELAHNLVASHGAQHTFYMGAYIQSTIEKFMNLKNNYGR